MILALRAFDLQNNHWGPLLTTHILPNGTFKLYVFLALWCNQMSLTGIQSRPFVQAPFPRIILPRKCEDLNSGTRSNALLPAGLYVRISRSASSESEGELEVSNSQHSRPDFNADRSPFTSVGLDVRIVHPQNKQSTVAN